MALNYMSGVAKKLDLNVDTTISAAYGNKGGYSLSVMTFDGYSMIVTLSVCDNNQQKPVDTNLRQILKDIKGITKITTKDYLVTIRFKPAFWAMNRFKFAINGIPQVVEALKMNGYINCAEDTLETSDITMVVLQGKIHFYTQERAQQELAIVDEEVNNIATARENYILGTLFAIVGTILGVIAIVIIGRLGYIAILGGVFMGFASLVAYKMGSGKLSKVGVAICIALMIVGVYLANRIDFALSLTQIFHNNGYSSVRMMDSFSVLPQMISEGYIESYVYYGQLAIQYLAALGGAIVPIRMLLGEEKSKSTSKILG